MSEVSPQLVANRYRLVEPLGQGGMGRVWKARDEVLHRDVAIKELVPPPSLTTDERREMRERSLREARAIARLNHINVVRVFDVLRTDADPWIVMEYVPSRSLQDALSSDGPVSATRAAEIGLGVLGALKAAHRAGVMHRDVKPGNVLLGDDGRVVLTDFGLATVPGDPNVTRTGLVLGSPAYIAPERARDGTAGPEGDLWSLGATLYAAVEGQSPFARSSAIATLAALATEQPPPAKRAGPLKAVLNGLLRKDPSARIDAETAERLLRRAAGRRTRSSLPLLDGVRRPSPHGPRPERTKIVPLPAQRPPQDRPSAPVRPTSVERTEVVTPTGPTSVDRTEVVPPAAPSGTGESATKPGAEEPPESATGAAATSSGTEEVPASGFEGRSGDAPSTAGEPETRVERETGAGSESPVGPETGAGSESPVGPETGAGSEPAAGSESAAGSETVAGREKSEAEASSTLSDTATTLSDTATRIDPVVHPPVAATSVVVPGPTSGGRAVPPPAAPAPNAETAPARATALLTAMLPGTRQVGGGRNGPLPDVPRRVWLIGGLALLLLLALVVVVPLVNRDGEPGGDTRDPAGDQRPTAAGTQPAAPAPSAAASPSPSLAPLSSAAPANPPPNTGPAGQAEQVVPDGWRLHRDPTGFSVPVPVGWSVSRAGSIVYFREANSGRWFLIDQTDSPQPDPVADWRSKEPHRRDTVSGYERVGQIGAVDYYLKAADWEWRYTDNGNRRHTRNRGFITARDQAYAIRWDTLASEWDENLVNFDIIANGFRPVRG